jgi:hypothetical protein
MSLGLSQKPAYLKNLRILLAKAGQGAESGLHIALWLGKAGPSSSFCPGWRHEVRPISRTGTCLQPAQRFRQQYPSVSYKLTSDPAGSLSAAISDLDTRSNLQGGRPSQPQDDARLDKDGAGAAREGRLGYWPAPTGWSGLNVNA